MSFVHLLNISVAPMGNGPWFDFIVWLTTMALTFLVEIYFGQYLFHSDDWSGWWSVFEPIIILFYHIRTDRRGKMNLSTKSPYNALLHMINLITIRGNELKHSAFFPKFVRLSLLGLTLSFTNDDGKKEFPKQLRANTTLSLNHFYLGGGKKRAFDSLRRSLDNTNK